MKKIFIYGMISLLLGIFCTTMMSCSSDDDNPSSSLAFPVGSWRCDWNDQDYDIITFNANGTGSWYMRENGYIYDDAFRWTYDKNRSIITITYTSGEDRGETDKLYLSNITSTSFVFEGGLYRKL